MQLDKDGIISILIGVVLVGIALAWKMVETPDPVSALVGLVVETVRGGLVGLGLLFVVVGLLFIFG